MLLVLGVVGVADTCANVATIQTELARLVAAPLWGLFEIVGARRFYLLIWMILTAQGQSIPDLVLLLQSVEDVAPQFDLAQHFPIANTVETFLGTRQGYTDAIGNAQEANFTLRVAADQRQQHNVVLFSLVLVHYVHFDPIELAGRHKVAQAVELPGIGCEYGYLLWFVVLKDKIAAKRDYKHRLMFVLMAFPISDVFFMVAVLHKE